MTEEERTRMQHARVIAADMVKLGRQIERILIENRIPVPQWPWILAMFCSQQLGIHTAEWQALREQHRGRDLLEGIAETGETGANEDKAAALAKVILHDGRYFTARFLGYLSMGLRDIQQEQDTEAALEQTLKAVTD